MGQYFLVGNLDTGEFISNSQLSDGVKLREHMGGTQPGLRDMLLTLLAAGNGKGGGDLTATWGYENLDRDKYHPLRDRYARRYPDGIPEDVDRALRIDCSTPSYPMPNGHYLDVDMIIGRWAGARTVMAGDYATREEARCDTPPDWVSEEVANDDSGTEPSGPYVWFYQCGKNITHLVMPIIEHAENGVFVGSGERNAIWSSVSAVDKWPFHVSALDARAWYSDVVQHAMYAKVPAPMDHGRNRSMSLAPAKVIAPSPILPSRRRIGYL